MIYWPCVDRVAQGQSKRLLSAGPWVRIPPRSLRFHNPLPTEHILFLIILRRYKSKDHLRYSRMRNRYQVYPVGFRTVYCKILDLASVVPTTIGSSSRTGMVVEASRSKFYIFAVRSPRFTLHTP